MKSVGCKGLHCLGTLCIFNTGTEGDRRELRVLGPSRQVSIAEDAWLGGSLVYQSGSDALGRSYSSLRMLLL